MGIDLGRFDIPVPQKFLDRPNIVAVLKQVGGKTVAEYMGAYLFSDTCNACGFPDSMVYGIQVNMMSSFDAGSWVHGQRV